jgi:hypothetical protein
MTARLDVVMLASDGSTREYRLRRTEQGLRLIGVHATYDLATMMNEEGWRIVGVRTEAAKKLLSRAGLLTAHVAILARRRRWRTRLDGRLPGVAAVR